MGRVYSGRRQITHSERSTRGHHAALEGIELADKKVLENGVFTYAIKEAFAKDSKVRDKNGYISAKALRSYVLKLVAELTTDVNGIIHQSPMVARDIAGRDWVVVK